MSRFVETIKLKDGIFYNLSYHQNRLNRTCLEHSLPNYNITQLLQAQSFPLEGLIKARFLYDEKGVEMQFHPYEIRNVQSLKLIEDNSIDYTYKLTNRSALKALYEQRKNCDDILIVKDGWVTDSYYANVIFSDGDQWYTPYQPLLQGTKRQELIDLGVVHPIPIGVKDIARFQRIQLINAMIDIEDQLLISSIQ
jgi:4-amino-4-deoxychorismate lyase